MTRLVLDASALLSGIASNPERPPGLLIAALYEGRFESIVCPRLLGEVRRGLTRGYFRNHVAEEEIERVVLTIATASVQLRDPKDPPTLLRDPTDDYLVALALTARARAIVTGDKDLLDHPGLHPPALTLRAACELLELI
ncbi:MAG: putative toxin-antitoxin system toxin component, PIN family [Actinobacteria bacterium]|nr:putative toxin-antitoxin system toxin component, PIN family [Actinomycetota bacterium]